MVDHEEQLDWSPMPHQYAVIRRRPPADAPAGPIIEAVLGGWGSAKTSACAMAFAANAMQYGWNENYGDGNPRAIVCSPTLTLAETNQLRLIRRLLPREAVKKRWGMPKPRILLRNGLEVLCISAQEEYEGDNVVMCWCDEISKPAFADNPSIFTNLVARLRDPKRTQKHTRMWVSGLPTAGWVREMFEVKERDPTRHTSLWSMRLNTKLDAGLRAQILKTTPYGQEATFLEGKWQPLEGALFPQWDDSRHLVDDAGEAGLVEVGLDVGNRSAAIIGQRRQIPGSTDTRLHIVDEVLGDGLSVAHLLDELDQRLAWKHFHLVPGRSQIAVDPTLRRDELAAIYARYPGVHVEQRKRSDEYYDVERGLRLMGSALRNAAEDRPRLTIARHLARNRRGIVESFVRLRRSPKTGRIMVDDLRDHPNDACRYLACAVLGKQYSRPEVIGSR